MPFHTMIAKTSLQKFSTLPRKFKSVKGSWIFNRQCSLPGSGAGKGGGGGGSVRDAGGGLGRFGAAQEEGYFYNQEREKLSKLKKQLKKDGSNLQQKDDKDNKPSNKSGRRK